MDNVVVYLPKKSYLNEATDFYIKMLCSSVPGKDPIIVYSLREISDFPKVVVIDAKSFLFAKIRYPSKKIITWYQGVVPEEALMIFDSKLRYFYWSLFEYLSLNFSFLNIFVSRSMCQHYNLKYKYSKSNYLIIPCFNKEVSKCIIIKKNQLSFVYAGSLHKWQCVEKMLDIFICIQRREPSATLDFFTFDVKLASSLIESMKVKNVNLERVGLDEIDERISHSKYGFLIRDDHVVNNVATPTKLSTYLSVFTKPILSDVVIDFKYNIPSSVCLFVPAIMGSESIATLIIEDFYSTASESDFKIECENLFRKYFNRDVYIKMINEYLN